MRHPELTLEDVRTYFAEQVYESPTVHVTSNERKFSQQYTIFFHNQNVYRQYATATQPKQSTSVFPYPSGFAAQ